MKSLFAICLLVFAFTAQASAMEAADGPILASLRNESINGREATVLRVVYNRHSTHGFDYCEGYPRTPKPNFVFVVGEANNRQSLSIKGDLSCSSKWGDNLGSRDQVTLRIVAHEQPELFDALFPKLADGNRWFALQVAFVDGYGRWDSRNGENYRLILR